MPRSTNRNLPKSKDLMVVKEELEGGRRIVVVASAGPRLSGKKGIVLGPGATASQVKVLLDGAKRYINCTPATLICLKNRLLDTGAEKEAIGIARLRPDPDQARVSAKSSKSIKYTGDPASAERAALSC